MAFTAQIVVFDVFEFAGQAVDIPANLNPSGYDIVALDIEVIQPLAAEPASLSTTRLNSIVWYTIGGSGPSVPPSGTLLNAVGVPALPLNNGGAIRPAGAFAAVFAGSPVTVARFTATLRKESGGGQGQR